MGTVSGATTSAPCPNRSFDRLSLALKEVIDVRLWSASTCAPDAQGAVLGKKVARYLEKHYFLPTG